MKKSDTTLADDANTENRSTQVGLQDSLGEGLTDDERVSREHEGKGDGARVTLGPADLERLPPKP